MTAPALVQALELGNFEPQTSDVDAWMNSFLQDGLIDWIGWDTQMPLT
jgi:hypothetical protein